MLSALGLLGAFWASAVVPTPGFLGRKEIGRMYFQAFHRVRQGLEDEGDFVEIEGVDEEELVRVEEERGGVTNEMTREAETMRREDERSDGHHSMSCVSRNEISRVSTVNEIG